MITQIEITSALIKNIKREIRFFKKKNRLEDYSYIKKLNMELIEYENDLLAKKIEENY
jgi:hypothetical protein